MKSSLMFVVLLALFIPAAGRAALAQNPPTDEPTNEPVNSPTVEPATVVSGTELGQGTAPMTSDVRLPTPGGAFVRSLLVPGWGQAAFGAYTRASVYFATRSASAFMLLKTMAKLSEAHDVERRLVGIARDSLLAAAVADTALFRKISEPGGLDREIGATGPVSGARILIDSRKQQREDWITWSIFWLLASGVDAFVTAHLADFPTQLSASPSPAGGMRVQLRVPAGRGP